MTDGKGVLKRSIIFSKDKDHLLASADVLCDIKAPHPTWGSERHRRSPRQPLLSLKDCDVP